VDYNSSLQVTIAVQVRSVLEVHAATTILAIRRGHEVGIVVGTFILNISDNCVAVATVVVLLEITSFLVESITTKHIRLSASADITKCIPIVKIVNHISRIKELSDSCVNVFPGLVVCVIRIRLLQTIGKVKSHAFARIRSIVILSVS
jgi:hypothetical protein